MGGPNLEVFKFGMYIMFPIAWMYYFGVNLDKRFAVSDFWPKPEETYKIPFEKQDIAGELERLRRKRLERRAKRLDESGEDGGEGGVGKAQEGQEGLVRMEGREEAPAAQGRLQGEQGRGQEQGREKSWWRGIW